LTNLYLVSVESSNLEFWVQVLVDCTAANVLSEVWSSQAEMVLNLGYIGGTLSSCKSGHDDTFSLLIGIVACEIDIDPVNLVVRSSNKGDEHSWVRWFLSKVDQLLLRVKWGITANLVVNNEVVCEVTCLSCDHTSVLLFFSQN
jgi:hypothetical protein